MKRPSAKWSKSSETPIGQHLSVIGPNDWSRSGSESVYLLVLALCSKCRFRAWAWHARRSCYALNADLEHGRGTRGFRAYALNSDLEHGRGLGPWSIAEKLQLR